MRIYEESFMTWFLLFLSCMLRGIHGVHRLVTDARICPFPLLVRFCQVMRSWQCQLALIHISATAICQDHNTDSPVRLTSLLVPLIASEDDACPVTLLGDSEESSMKGNAWASK